MPKDKSTSNNSTTSIYTQVPIATDPRIILERMAEGVYRTDPALGAKDMLGMELDGWQRDVINTLFLGEKKRVSVRAGHGVGKTVCAATIAHLFLNTYMPCKIIATGPSSKQTRLQFWSALNDTWQKNFLKDHIEWLKTKMYFKGHEEQWFAAWVPSKNPKNVEGFHGENLLWIIEEAKGVADAVFESVQGALSQSNNFFYISSTCGLAKGYFWETHTQRLDQWDVFKIPSWESPRVAPEKIEIWKKEWGEDSPIFQARVAAEFPAEDDFCLCPLSWLLRSIEDDDDI